MDAQARSSNLSKGRNGKGEVDSNSIDYAATLENWRERERRFIRGERERLPTIKGREYYYWDRQGVRHGPLNEAEMRLKFDSRQVNHDTIIAPITTATGTEALPKLTVNEYFPDSQTTFTTAPSAASVGGDTWLYLDDSGKVQGPFHATQMREWFLDSYFNAETKARLASRTDAEFVPLGILFGQDGADAFLSEGNQEAAAKYKPSAKFSASMPPPVAIGSNNSNFAPQATAYDPYGMPVAAPGQQAGYDDLFGSPQKTMAKSSNVTLTPNAQSGKALLTMAIGASTAPASNNPFEAPDYQTPMRAASGKKDDWDITWDDEQDEKTEMSGNDPEAPVMVSTGDKDTRNLATFEKIQHTYLSSHEALYHFLTRGLPKELGVVKCKIRRSLSGMMHINYNQYELFLEKDDGSIGPQIMVAVKHKRMGFDSYFQIVIGSASPMHSGTIIAEETMSTLGTAFLLHNNVKSHSGTARDLGCIHYLRTGSGGGPRKMTVAIPGFVKKSESEFVEWPHGGSIKKSTMMQAINSLNFKDMQPLMNKPPVWSDKKGAWTLNFHGRVTRASVKNFQLVRPEDHEHVVLQHGRVGQDMFSMDMGWPVSPIQAFAVCVSSLHAKLAVE